MLRSLLAAHSGGRLQLGEPVTRLSRLGGMLGSALEAACAGDEPLAEAAAAALGHLVRSGGPLTADLVEREARHRPTRLEAAC